MKYYKIFNEIHTHHEMEYKKGLNTDSIPFNSNPNDSCVEGGLYFSDKENICQFLYNKGVFIREITLPDNELVVKDDNKYRSHSIILKKKHDLRNVKTWEWIIKQGINIHAHNDQSLIWASQYGHLDIVKFLLVEKGADIHAMNDYALRLASINGHLDVVKFLVEKGADISAENDLALVSASGHGQLDVVKFLMEKGAIHARNDLALTWASENGHTDVVNYLKGLN